MKAGVYYASLTVPQLKEMLSAARADRIREVRDLEAKRTSEVMALQQTLGAERDAHAQQIAELITNWCNEVAELHRDLAVARDEVNRLRAANADQARRLEEYTDVSQLLRKLAHVQPH
jgi:hypothetical protein